MYNFYEKLSFLRLIRASRRIVSTAALRRKRIIGFSQDVNREFISLLAASCANGTALPLALIYQGESGDFQDTWLEKFDSSSEEAFFAVPILSLRLNAWNLPGR